MVFTPEQVRHLWEYQHAGLCHPFTCPDRGDGQHQVIGSDLGMLVPTTDGWICPFCDYKQDWAHGFMTDGSAVGMQRGLLSAARTLVASPDPRINPDGRPTGQINPDVINPSPVAAVGDS